MGTYNIYAGIKGKPLSFQYIRYNISKEDALKEAREVAIEMFEDSEEFNTLWEQCFETVEQEINDGVICALDLYNQIVTIKANNLYEELVDDFILYDAIKQE